MSPFPYTFEFNFDTISTDYIVQVDWDNDGNFTGSSDTLLDFKSIQISRGKDLELGKAQVGQLILTLKNETGKYTPTNTNSVLYGLLKPKRPIKVYANRKLTDYPLFYGYIEEITPRPHLSEQDCIITALDGLDYLSRQELETSLLKDVYTGSIVSTILDNSSWSSTLRKIDTGQDTVPFWYGHDILARYALEEIEDSELGFIYVNASGDLVWEDRHHRWSATHQTSQFTVSNSMTEIGYSISPKNVFNVIKSTITPWELSASAELLWQIEEVPSLDIGETKTFWGESSASGQSVFVDDWSTLVASTDYVANSASTGAGDNETANISVSQTEFAKSIKINITNNAAHIIYLTTLQAKGRYYDDQTKTTITKEDTNSQSSYQKRTLDKVGKYQNSTDIAQGYCNVAISKYREPTPETNISLVNSSSTLLIQMLSREISDRITVVNEKLGLNSEYYIDNIEHNITNSGLYHNTNWQLSDAENDDFWVLDYSALATTSVTGQTKLAY